MNVIFPDSISEMSSEEFGYMRMAAFSELPKWMQEQAIERHEYKKKIKKKQYWLDNCGDHVWYCQHCDQEECGKRMARRIFDGSQYPPDDDDDYNEN